MINFNMPAISQTVPDSLTITRKPNVRFLGKDMAWKMSTRAS